MVLAGDQLKRGGLAIGFARHDLRGGWIMFLQQIKKALRKRVKGNCGDCVRCGGVAHAVIVASLWRRQFTLQASERFAERVAPVAQTTHPSQAGLARVLNSLGGATLSATRDFSGALYWASMYK